MAIVGQQPTTALGSEYQQEIDLPAPFKDVAARDVQTVLAAEQAGMVPDRAFRTALGPGHRAPSCSRTTSRRSASEPPPSEHGVIPTAAAVAPAPSRPADGDLEDAGDLVRALAERLGGGVTTSLLGKPWWDETLPISCGVMGHLHHRLRSAHGRRLHTADGRRQRPVDRVLPTPGQARAVQIDLDGRHLGHRYPVDVGLVGDAGETITALLPLLDDKSDTTWRSDVDEQVEQRRRIAEDRARTDAVPLSPERLVRALTPRLAADAQVSVDVGSVV